MEGPERNLTALSDQNCEDTTEKTKKRQRLRPVNSERSHTRNHHEGVCHSNLSDCPLLRKYQERLRKHEPSENKKEMPAAKEEKPLGEDENSAKSIKLLKEKSNELAKEQSGKGKKSCSHFTLIGIRSNRALELRSQRNRDLLQGKQNSKKVWPYIHKHNRAVAQEQEQYSSKLNCEKEESFNEFKLERQKTKDILSPRVKLRAENEKKKKVSLVKIPGGHAGGDVVPAFPKSNTFLVYKGCKLRNVELVPSSSSGDDECPSPSTPRVLKHQDSFCLIARSTQTWASARQERSILKQSRPGSTDSDEGEKKVRFTDQDSVTRIAFRKLSRRKRRMEKMLFKTLYRKNSHFLKQLEVLKRKSVLFMSSPLGLAKFELPIVERERYEAEMLGLIPRLDRWVHTRSLKVLPSVTD